MNNTVRYNSQLINDFDANNFFGEGDTAAVQSAFISAMKALGFTLGNEYDTDAFDSAAGVAIEIMNTGFACNFCMEWNANGYPVCDYCGDTQD